MGIEHERAFEDEICEHLAAHGWLYEPDANARYDRGRALYPEDVFAWLQETQPQEWTKVVKPDASAQDQDKAKSQLLDRLVKTLDAPLSSGGGTLNVLRRGFKKTPAHFDMCAFKPATTFNATAQERYQAVRLRVIRQVYYGARDSSAPHQTAQHQTAQHNKSIDLVLLVNGLPVATIELKTENTQSLDHAIAQYRTHRDPKGEPLLGFANRCLVHFAVSNDQVAMTTHLRGKQTHFLPFNRGNKQGAGNPTIPGKAASSYLWEDVLDRDAWLHIIGKLLHIEQRTSTDPISGEVTTSTTLLFPRYHQWELVTRLLATAREEGPGHKYLVQHSAGSGKTNSIAWLAHGLATLHYGADHPDANTKVFDTVIVVTDRTVLDDQLQKAISQIEGVSGTVATINADQVRKAGDSVKSKSALLAKELQGSKPIVIVTLQTFPHALEAIRENAGLASRTFAIIADEAHSSQTGTASKKLRQVLTSQVLTPEEQHDLDDGGELDAEAILAAEIAARAESPHLSFFAFTATPKAKTLELFGRRDDAGLPQAFHVYSMQQAIEEGYILDVLKNYTTYATAFQIAEADKRRLKALHDEDLVDESEATTRLMRWVSLHPTNIAQKVQIIVEHYRANVRHLLDGHAKAMVVTSSREHAVRYKEAIDAYIAKKGYPLATLVAFSGTMSESQVPGVTFPGVTPPYSEANLNTRVGGNAGLRGRTLPVAFGSDDFQVLIVANKYQTGFDQPLLCAMYVDKRLAGVAAVQTLSRLNRTYAAGGKDATYILDFVNEPQEILEAFLPYYGTAELTEATDPDIVHDLQAKLDAAGIYTDDEVVAFAESFLGDARHSAHTAPLKTAADRFNQRYSAAAQSGSKADINELDLFRKDVGSFVRLYDFLSQIVNYGDTGVEKRSLFLRLLLPRLTGRVSTDPIDFSAVELTHIKQARTGEHELDLASGEATGLKPPGSKDGVARDPRLVRLEEILARINELFADEDFSESSVESWVQGVVTVLAENEQLRTQASVNSRSRFVESPDLATAVTDAVLEHRDNGKRIVDYFFSHESVRVELVRRLGELVHENLALENSALAHDDDAA